MIKLMALLSPRLDSADSGGMACRIAFNVARLPELRRREAEY
jgi:hypothetical protein